MLILGAKGFAKELLEAVYLNNPSEKVYFYDDVSADVPDTLYGRYPVLRSTTAAQTYFMNTDARFALGIGKPSLRFQLSQTHIALGGSLTTVISPYAHIGHFGNQIGDGCTIMSGTVITNDIRIGTGCLINLNCTIGHDSVIGAYSELSPGVHISGHVHMGEQCSLGTGAVILPGVKLGNYVTVGAGAVVVKDVADHQTVVGIPAKPFSK